MISEQIEKIKSEYTDKYVTVRAEKPELVRFENYVGQVKTVNMSGRALVQFDDFNQNTGWYDIELDYLKVVDKPLPKESRRPASRQVDGKPAVKKPAAAAGEKKLSPLELARQQGAAKSSDATVKKAPTGKKSAGKPSTADILAAARADSAKSPAQAAGQAPKAKGASKPAQQAGSSQPKEGKLSTADILAAARGDSAKSPAPKTKGAAEPAEAEPRTAVQVSGAANAPKSAQPTVSSEPKGKSDMSPEDICTWCREHDAV
jgi:hypothetical protein